MACKGNQSGSVTRTELLFIARNPSLTSTRCSYGCNALTVVIVAAICRGSRGSLRKAYPLVVNFTLPGLRSHTLQTRAFSSLAFSHLCTPPSSPGLARSLPGPRPASPVPRPVLARPHPASPGPRPASPGPRPALVSSNLAVKTGKREIYYLLGLDRI